MSNIFTPFIKNIKATVDHSVAGKNLMLTIILILFLCVNSYSQTEVNYDESKVPVYELPELLTASNGMKITNPKEWINIRRPEILSLFENNMFGKTPLQKVKIEFEVTKYNENAFCGNAIFKEVTATFLNGENQVQMNILIYLPKNTPKPVPVILGMNFYGNHTIHPDTNISLTRNWVRNKAEFNIFNNEATHESRGVRAYRWPVERILESGYGLATIYYGDLDPDYDDGFKNGIHQLFYGKNQSEIKANQMGAIGAWSWGLSRAMDYFEDDEDINHEQVVLFGHSRLGKAALWAGAQDQRFAIVLSNNSGCGGAALSRRRFGETIEIINNKFPHWFCKNFHKYNNKENLLPLDQHMLIALIAPRPLYVASAEKDLWADPKGEFLSALYASEVYELFGKDGLKVNKIPEVNKPISGSLVGYHIRQGIHDVTRYDWERYMDFADFHFQK